MTTGYILVLAVLILGGVIATLGDRIGMRVGKARLSLFNLRPRQTATVVSILTGSVISASTLALLFGVSRQLRTGVFELEQIQSELAQAEADLQTARETEANIEADLLAAREQERQAQAGLEDTRTQLGQLRSQLQDVSTEAGELQTEIERLETERTALTAERDREIAERDRELQNRDVQIEQREQRLSQLQAERDREIAERDVQIEQREQRLTELQTQQALLQEDVATLERQYEGLFRGNVVVSRNEPLISGLLQVTNAQEARQAFDQLLREANRTAIRAIAPDIDPRRRVILISPEEINQLAERIEAEQEYVVRVLAAANYVIGEPCVVTETTPCVQVFVDAVPNEIVYDRNERLVTVAVEIENLNNQALVEKLNLLIASLQFRARQDGIVGDTLQIARGRTPALLAFLETIKRNQRPVDIQAIASEPIYTLGPLQVELLAVAGGEILARTDELPRRPSLERDPSAPEQPPAEPE